jgi:hypothetical protein
VFFMIYPFRGKVEPNWTIPAFVPILIIAYRTFAEKIKARRWILPVAAISMVLLLAFRVYLVYDFLNLPRNLVNLTELYGWKEWSKEVEKKSEGYPVLFLNSYQRTSKYIFYTGKPAYTMEDYSGHRTQYYYWSGIEKELQGKKIMVVDFAPGRWLTERKALVTGNNIITYYGFWDKFTSHYKLELRFKLKELRFPANSTVTLPVAIINPYNDTVRFNENRWMPTRLVYHVHHKDHFDERLVASTDLSNMVITGAERDTTVRFKTPALPGHYYLWVSVSAGWLPSARNMNYQKMEIY